MLSDSIFEHRESLLREIAVRPRANLLSQPPIVRCLNVPNSPRLGSWNCATARLCQSSSNRMILP